MILNFRVWQIEERKMYPVQMIRTNVSGSTTVNATSNSDWWNPVAISGEWKSGELLQSTGLFDATKWSDLEPDKKVVWRQSGRKAEDWKGVEIWEGDIFDTLSGYKFEVVLWKGCFMIQQVGTECPSRPVYEVSDQWKIVGNIYEQSELIKQSKLRLY